MLGSKKNCPNCDATSFRRVKVNRTIQCTECNLIVEERCISDLAEYFAVTQTEEIHCVVAPDHLHKNLVDDIPNDPYCTPGFISGFRMLSPLREPVYAATARTLSGALAEMERVIGDALFAGYVGYNGRAPGSASKKEEAGESGERNKSGGDARHTLVAYFEIIELASILCVDRETANLAIRTFRHTANNTSLRNRNVESLATAAFVSAAERRWHEYDEWRKLQNSATNKHKDAENEQHTVDSALPTSKDWPVPPRQLTVEEISIAANLDTSEVLRYLKVVNVALRKQRPENSSSITTHMPTFCRRLDLPPSTRKLAIGLAERAMENNICSRRNPISISAAAIYMACQMDGIRKTQTEICRATTLTEVTLRKVYKELNRERALLIPDWYIEIDKKNDTGPSETERQFSRFVPRRLSLQETKCTVANRSGAVTLTDGANPSPGAHELDVPLERPPLPPGFGDNLSTAEEKVAEQAKPPTVAPAVAGLSLPSHSNPMLAMLNNPAMQAFANAFTMMPQLMPPPPPPLPTLDPTNSPPSAQIPSKEQVGREEQGDVNVSGKVVISQQEKAPTEAGISTVPGLQLPPLPPRLPVIPVTPLPSASGPLSSSSKPGQPPADNLMAGMQSMMGMMQAMQAFQALQKQSTAPQVAGQDVDQMNPIAMMAMAIAQARSIENTAPAAAAAVQQSTPSSNNAAPAGQTMEENGSQSVVGTPVQHNARGG